MVGCVLLVVMPVVQVASVRVFTPLGTPAMLQRMVGSGLSGDWRGVAYRPVPIEAMGSVPRAVVASEDARFWVHHGFDWPGICDATADHRRGKPLRGASTITQQAARSLFLWQGRSWARKGLEAWYALWMELLLPKERILELYLGVAETGDHVFGFEAAAWHWYGKPASALSAEQARRIAGVLPSPRTRAPGGPASTERAAWIADHPAPFPGDPGYDLLVAWWAAHAVWPWECVR